VTYGCVAVRCISPVGVPEPEVFSSLTLRAAAFTVNATGCTQRLSLFLPSFLMHRYMSGVSVLLLLPTALLLEPGCFEEAITRIQASNGFTAWLISNSILAYFVNLLNFLVTKHTSALTLQVLGNAKGVVAAVISVFVFKNVVTWVGWSGERTPHAPCTDHTHAKIACAARRY
jgi:Triose-phosphate Transporter family